MEIGFSTGSLAKGDFDRALKMLLPFGTRVIELSALREPELDKLISSFDNLDLSAFGYVSVHAPSKLFTSSEEDMIQALAKLTIRSIPVIVHPDIITDFAKWKKLGHFLCIENMDKRKPVGRTASDLETIFEKLPEAQFCLDIAHAKQIDPSMVESVKMLRQFGNRLMELHISDVTSDSSHVPLNVEAILAYRKIEALIPRHKPLIIESPVTNDYIHNEIEIVSSIFHTSNAYARQHHPFIHEASPSMGHRA